MRKSLYLISPPRGNFLAVLPEVLKTGVGWFQYRRENLSDRAMLEEIIQLKRITDRFPTKLIINDRPDLALSAGADGVHLGVDDLPPEAVKKAWPDLIVGATRRANESTLAGVDYYGVGPVFSPVSKKLNIQPCGWSGIDSFLKKTKKPVFAIGGLTPERIKQAPSNLAGVVAVSAVWNADAPPKATRELLNILSK